MVLRVLEVLLLMLVRAVGILSLALLLLLLVNSDLVVASIVCLVLVDSILN